MKIKVKKPQMNSLNKDSLVEMHRSLQYIRAYAFTITENPKNVLKMGK